jgi:hypothetical protein
MACIHCVGSEREGAVIKQEKVQMGGCLNYGLGMSVDECNRQISDYGQPEHILAVFSEINL